MSKTENESKNKIKFEVSKQALEAFVSASTQTTMKAEQQISNTVNSVPVAKKMSDRIKSFDDKMIEKFGRTYKTIRSIAVMSGIYVAAVNCGAAGLLAYCGYRMIRKARPFLNTVEKQRQKGQVTGVIDYMDKHKVKSADTLSSVAFGTTSAVSILAGFELPLDFGEIKAIGKNAIKVGQSTIESVLGKKSWKETGEVLLNAALAVTASTEGVNSVVESSKGVKKESKPEEKAEEIAQRKAEEKTQRIAMMNQMLSRNGTR